MMAWTRRREPEWMDQPQLPAELHQAALRGLARVNAWSRSGQALWSAVRPLARELAPRPLKLLDLATGGGDVALRVAALAAHEGLPIELLGLDRAPFALGEARRRAADLGLRGCEFRAADVLHEPLPTGFDVVMCSLFLHHLDEAEAVSLLGRMAAAGQMVLVDDLRRTRLGYALARVGVRLLTRSPVVHKDGPLSVQGAFNSAEALRLAECAGLRGATVRHHWPQRFLLSWRRP